MGSLIPLLLRALKYPGEEGFDLDSPGHLQAAVVWLENTKVRRYPVEARAALQSPDPATWQAALAKYLADLECPLALGGGSGGPRAVLQWLLTHAGACRRGWCRRWLRRAPAAGMYCPGLPPCASTLTPPAFSLAPAVGLEYTDAAQQLSEATAAAEAAAGPPEAWTDAQLPPLPDITAPGVLAALVQLQRLLHVQDGAAAAEATPASLHAAHAMLDTCVLPALAELAKQAMPTAGGGGAPTAAASQHAAVGAMLAQYPLGFSTGDAGADLAATILRMLYIKDLRQLQVRHAVGCVATAQAVATCAWWLARGLPPPLWWEERGWADAVRLHRRR